MPDGIERSDIKDDLWVSLHRKGGYTRGCAIYEETYATRPILVGADLRATIEAPPVPAYYEVRLYRGDAARVHYGSPRFPKAALLARADVDVLVPLVPSAITGVRDLTVDDTLTLSATVPSELPYTRYKMVVVRNGNAAPGGAPEASFVVSYQRGLSQKFEPELRYGKSDTSGRVTAILNDPVLSPGKYEVRLQPIAEGLYANLMVARRQFTVRDPAFPQAGGGSPSMTTDWPEEDDRIRRLTAWLVPRDECVDPSFPEPPEFRFVELIGNDPLTEEDDVYQEVTGIYLGYPFFIEANFDTAPPEVVYRVRVGEDQRVKIRRTEDPKLFRSGIVVLTGEDGG